MRQRHEKHQPHVGDRGFGMEESLQAKREDDRRPEPGAIEIEPPSPGKNGDRRQRRGERLRETAPRMDFPRKARKLATWNQ